MPQLQFATAADMHQTRGQAKEFGKGELRGGWNKRKSTKRATKRQAERQSERQAERQTVKERSPIRVTKFFVAELVLLQ